MGWYLLIWVIVIPKYIGYSNMLHQCWSSFENHILANVILQNIYTCFKCIAQQLTQRYIILTYAQHTNVILLLKITLYKRYFAQ